MVGIVCLALGMPCAGEVGVDLQAFADDIAGLVPSGAGRLVESSASLVDTQDQSGQGPGLAIDYTFEQGPSQQAWVVYDITSVVGGMLPRWTVDQKLVLDAKLPVGHRMILQVQTASGRWFQTLSGSETPGWNRFSFTLDRRTFGDTWLPGSTEPYRSAIYPPIQRLRIGVRGAGRGTATFAGLKVVPVYESIEGELGNTDYSGVTIDAETAKLSVQGAPAGAAVVRAADFGAVADDGKDDSEAIRAALAACQAQAPARLLFQPGRYDLLMSGNGVAGIPDLDRIGLLLSDLHDLTIDGQGAEMILHREASAIVLRSCQNVLIQNLRVDWERPPFTQGMVVSMRDVSIDVVVDPGFVLSDGLTVNKVMRFDSESRLLDDAEPLIVECGRRLVGDGPHVDEFVKTPWRTSLAGDGIIRMHCGDGDEAGQRLLRSVREGDLLLLRHGDYRNNGVTVIDSDGVLFQDVSIYAAAGMGYWANNSGDLGLERFRIEPRPDSGRLMSVTADGLQFKDCHGTLQIEACKVLRQGDDCLNVKGRYHRIVEQDDARVTMKLWRQNSLPPVAGERFAVFSSGGEQIGVLEAGAVHATSDPMVWVLEAAGGMADWSGQATLLASLDHSPAAVVVRGCEMGENRGRGILLQARNALIEHNTIRSTSNIAIWVAHDPVRFGEAFPPSQVVIRDNHVSDCPRLWRQSAIEVSAFLSESPTGVHPFADIQINNNRITDWPADRSRGINVTGVHGLVIQGNQIQPAPVSPSIPGYLEQSAPILVRNCSNVRVSDNVLQASGAGPILLDVMSERTSTAAGNRNLTPGVLGE